MLILLIGPSSVGKTTCGLYAKKHLHINGCDFHDLDIEIQNLDPYHRKARKIYDEYGKEKFFDRSQEVLEELDRKFQEIQYLLVAIGAGSLASKRALSILERYPENILVIDNARKAYSRNRQKIGRSFDDYYKTEYVDRCQLYSSTKYKFWVDGLSKGKSTRQFKGFLENEVFRNIGDSREPRKE